MSEKKKRPRGRPPARDPRNAKFTMLFRQEEMASLARLAAADGRSMAGYVRHLLHVAAAQATDNSTKE